MFVRECLLAKFGISGSLSSLTISLAVEDTTVEMWKVKNNFKESHTTASDLVINEFMSRNLTNASLPRRKRKANPVIFIMSGGDLHT